MVAVRFRPKGEPDPALLETCLPSLAFRKSTLTPSPVLRGIQLVDGTVKQGTRQLLTTTRAAQQTECQKRRPQDFSRLRHGLGTKDGWVRRDIS